MVADTLQQIDAASLIALPAERPILGRHSREVSTAQALCDEILGDAPLLTHVWRSPYGRVGAILIPIVDMRLFEDRGKTVDATLKGVELAVEAGARCVSFTGMIPAATAYARDIADSVGSGGLGNGDSGSLSLTSGHAAVVAAFAFNVESILKSAGRAYDTETVAFVGIGSIGAGILRLLDEHLSAKRIFIVDVHQKRDALLRIKNELKGDVEVVTIEKGDGLPAWLYDRCSLFAVPVSDVDSACDRCRSFATRRTLGRRFIPIRFRCRAGGFTHCYGKRHHDHDRRRPSGRGAVRAGLCCLADAAPP